MKTKIAIYLAGSIKKEHEKSDETYWTSEDMDFLKAALKPLEVSFLNPAFRSDNLSDQLSVFGRDMLQVFSSDIVFVDARDRRGLGVGAEMMWAKLNRIPVITLAPMNTHYRKAKTKLLDVAVENWVHPFVESLSDYIAEDLADGVTWIQALLQGGGATVKGPELMHKAMRYYLDNQFQFDTPMKELILMHNELHERTRNIGIF